MLRYYLQVYGCQMNQNEAGLVRALMDGAGHVETADEAAADAWLMLTCTVRSHAEARALGRLGSFRARRGRGQGRVVAVLGCMAEVAGRALADEHGADIVLGPDRYRLLPGAIEETLATGRPVVAAGAAGECYEGILPRTAPGASPVRGSVTVMRGCDNWCSYCVVPIARGRERSRPLVQVLEEARALAGEGVRDLTLLGQNVLAWREGDRDFVGLLEAVAKLPGLLRLRFLTSHPKDFSERIARAMAAIPAVCPDLHLPAQSGSDRILALMNRGYTRAEYLARTAAARELLPGLGLSTDLMVGFPGESDEDFADTLDLARQVRFDAAYMFRYSVRRGTAAAGMGPKVSEAVAGGRLARLIELQNRVTREKNRALVGTEVELLVEAPASRGHGMLGRTRSNRTVVIDSPAAVGETLVVEVTGTRGWTPVAVRPAERDCRADAFCDCCVGLTGNSGG